MSFDTLVQQTACNAEWLPHRYAPVQDAFHFRKVTREAHRSATFLTDEYLGVEPNPIVLRRDDTMRAAAVPGEVHFIFHSAFCCSTLLARAFDIPGISMGLKEPTIYNDVVGWRQHGGPEPRNVAMVLDQATMLLARPFIPDEAVVIKPSNIVNGFADTILAMRPASAAVLLSAPLPVYLRSIAKKGLDGRLWVRDLMAKLAREGLIDLGIEGDDYLRLTDLQAAAVGWLAQHALFLRLASKYDSRVRMLNSEVLLARPREALSALAVLFGLDSHWVDAAVAGPAFTQHSKHGGAFNAAAREAEYNAAIGAHADELIKVEIWARRVASDMGLDLAPAAALLT